MKNLNKIKFENQLELPGINTGYYKDFISSSDFNLPALDKVKTYDTNYAQHQLDLFSSRQILS